MTSIRQFQRYIWLVDLLYSRGALTRQQINDYWQNASLNDENEAAIPRRTFFRMKDDILILFGIEIECVSGNKYAIANRDDIKSDDVQNWLLNSFSVSNLLMEGQSLKDRLLLEDIPSGNKYLTQVIDAMRQNLTLQVEYQSFKMSIARVFEIAPYCIKVFKQRWYIIGHREGNDEVHFYSLDRVLSMEITENAFKVPKSFNADAFLHNYYGVMAGTMPAESVLLRVTPFRANYLRSLPLHHSQKETERTDDYSVFEYWIAPTADFIQELRSFLPEITVLKPLWLRDKFIEEAKQVLKKLSVTMAKIESISDFPQNDLYRGFFAQNPFVKECIKKGQLSQTYWQGKYSNNSCSFIDMGKPGRKEKVCDYLKSLFEIENDIFDNKYKMAVAGDGQEYRRISTLHSSSLVALLCFYSLSKEHALKMNIDGQEIEFYESLFEQKNSIGKEGHNSNMDVVLIGFNKQGESVILFLESKFSEYLSHGKYDKISDVYDEVYYQLTADQQPIDGLEIVRGKDMWSISAAPHRPQQYCQGIKQMISHYQGVQKGFIGSAEDKYDHIYLGEILFKFPEEVDAKHNSYNSYVGLYKQLAQKLNSINTCKKFKVIETSLSYQDVLKDFDLDTNVREFYAL